MITYGNLDEITYDAEVDGELVRKTLGVRAWEAGSWSTVMIVFAERTKDLAAWRAPKVAVLRMRKVGDGWKKHSLVTLPAAHALSLGLEITSTFVDTLRTASDPAPDDLEE